MGHFKNFEKLKKDLVKAVRKRLKTYIQHIISKIEYTLILLYY